MSIDDFRSKEEDVVRLEGQIEDLGAGKALRLSVETEQAVERIKRDLKKDLSTAGVVGLAIELLQKAYGHRIHIVDRQTNRVIDSFEFWR